METQEKVYTIDEIKTLFNINEVSYTTMALKTLNKSCFTKQDMMLNASLGLSGEVGEVNDIIKKVIYHGHKLDEDTKNKIILELGDICWYIALMGYAINETKFEDILNKNIEKLDKRYHGEFSTEKSINREENFKDNKKKYKSANNPEFKSYADILDYIFTAFDTTINGSNNGGNK